MYIYVYKGAFVVWKKQTFIKDEQHIREHDEISREQVEA